MSGIHSLGPQAAVKEIMRKDFPRIADTDLLMQVQKTMEESGLRAIPVMRDGKIAGVVTLEDISRVYTIASQRNQT